MSMTLVARNATPDLTISSWHWRTIVEAVRDLAVLPDSTLDALHKAETGTLTADEALTVAQALRARLLPTLAPEDRLLLNGARTREPDNQVFHRAREEQWRNYSTDLATLTRFTEFCEASGGFLLKA